MIPLGLIGTAWSALTSKAGLAVLAVAAALGVLWAVDHNARQSARAEMAAQAAKTEQQARIKGDEAAADAARDGAGVRLRDGNF